MSSNDNEQSVLPSSSSSSLRANRKRKEKEAERVEELSSASVKLEEKNNSASESSDVVPVKEEQHEDAHSSYSDDSSDDTSTDESVRRQRQKLDNKVDRFFQRMYSVDHTNFESDVINTIHYGNLSDKYDPKSNQTSVTKTRLLLLDGAERGQEEQKNPIDEQSSLEIIKIIRANATSSKSLEDLKQSSTNIQELNLVKRNSILYLIERNRNNKIICPFDEFAFLKFKSQEAELESATSPNSNVVNMSDLSSKTNITKVNLVDLRFYDSNSSTDFMPNCLSSYLMPFFFDIFQPSELKKITSKMVDILLKLKTSYKPQVFLNEMSTESAFLTQLVDNCLWSCFALFNRRFHDKYKLGFLNYFISSVCYYRRVLLLKSDQLVDKESKILCNFKQVISFYVEALVLNGLIKPSDLKLVVQLAEQNPNAEYIQDVLEIMNQVLGKFIPMKLKDMCRILVKRSLKPYFDLDSVKQLKLNHKDTEFLLFNDEFQQYYKEIRRMLEL